MYSSAICLQFSEEDTTSFTTDDSGSVPNDDMEITYGGLLLCLTQGAFSRTKIKEDDPLEFYTLLGNVGGAF